MRSLIALGIVVAAGCLARVDYGATEFRCVEGECPTGQECVNELCVIEGSDTDSGIPVDASSTIDATAPDASAPDANIPDGVYRTSRAASPPTIDGDTSEFAGAQELSLVTVATGSMTTYRLMWDDMALYLAMDVSDTTLIADNTVDMRLWDDDGLEIMLDTLHDAGPRGPDDYKFFINLDNTHLTTTSEGNVVVLFESSLDIRGTVGVATDTDVGYSIEVRWPWADWGVTAPAAGTIWGFDVSFNDDDGTTSHQTIWRNTDGGSFNNPDGWGDLEFVP